MHSDSLKLINKSNGIQLKNYYYRYTKYKNKYLELKSNTYGQYGGTNPDYVQYLIDNENKIKLAKNIVDDFDPKYIKHTIVNQQNLNNNTISIVMTINNRALQTYYTLSTIAKSNYKNIQVVIVDDSDNPSLDIDKLKQYGMHIDYIIIINKFWINPCVNYNIGFKLIKGNKVIIQNSEVCHIGDIISYTNENLHKLDYLIFDVFSFNDMQSNVLLYNAKEITNTFIDQLIATQGNWHRNSKLESNKFKYHWLVAINRTDLFALNGFDYDFCIGLLYDDNEFINRIQHVLKLNIVTVPYKDKYLLGIYQWHEKNYYHLFNNQLFALTNKMLMMRKLDHYNATGNYIMLYKYDTAEYRNQLNILFDIK